MKMMQLKQYQMQYYDAAKKRRKSSLALNFWLQLIYVLFCLIISCNMYSNVNML